MSRYDSTWTGHLARAPEGQGYTGLLVDPWGWTLHLSATVETGPDGKPRFALVARLGDTPAELRLPGEMADRTPDLDAPSLLDAG